MPVYLPHRERRAARSLSTGIAKRRERCVQLAYRDCSLDGRNEEPRIFKRFNNGNIAILAQSVKCGFEQFPVFAFPLRRRVEDIRTTSSGDACKAAAPARLFAPESLASTWPPVAPFLQRLPDGGDPALPCGRQNIVKTQHRASSGMRNPPRQTRTRQGRQVIESNDGGELAARGQHLLRNAVLPRTGGGVDRRAAEK